MKQTNKQRSKLKKEPTITTPAVPDEVFEVDYLIGKALYYFFFIFLLTFIVTYI